MTSNDSLVWIFCTCFCILLSSIYYLWKCKKERVIKTTCLFLSPFLSSHSLYEIEDKISTILHSHASIDTFILYFYNNKREEAYSIPHALSLFNTLQQHAPCKRMHIYMTQDAEQFNWKILPRITDVYYSKNIVHLSDILTSRIIGSEGAVTHHVLNEMEKDVDYLEDALVEKITFDCVRKQT